MRRDKEGERGEIEETGGTGAWSLTSVMDGDTDLSARVIAAAIEVHRELGPGLLESVYRSCLVHELRSRNQRVETEVPLPLTYRGMRVGCSYRLDLVVEQTLIVELKAVDALEPLHVAQLLTYLRLTNQPLGLLINFNVPALKKGGIRRVVLSSVFSSPDPPSDPPRPPRLRG
jgi:GxxExxY protein